MIIGFGWTATFQDHTRTVVCTKPGAGAHRRVCYKYTGDHVPLKRIDCLTGTTATDDFNKIPAHSLDLLKDAARERWGSLGDEDE